MAALLLATAFAAPAGADEAGSLARAIKAAFLDKFPLYVTWPAQAFAAPADRFTLCIVGDEPFAALVERATAGQSVARHAIAVLRLRTVSAADHCAIIYIATREPRLVQQQLTAVAGRPVLTVTDGMQGAAEGMINFVIAADRVRFEIDNAAAVRSGLSVSSKLLSLAVAVRPAP
jgi:hypothetical protein